MQVCPVKNTIPFVARAVAPKTDEPDVTQVDGVKMSMEDVATILRPAPKPSHVAIGAICLGAMAVAAGRIAYDVASTGNVGLALGTVAGLAAGYTAADWLGGHVHHFFDNYPAKTGDGFLNETAAIFQTHHDWPHDMSESDIWHNTQHVGKFLAAPLVGLAAFTGAMHPAAAAFSLGALSGGFLAQAFHRYAHQKNPPVAIQLLQKAGIAVKPEPHFQHHKHPDDDYCLLNGMHNGWMQKTHYWRGVEAGIYKLGEAVGPNVRQAIGGTTDSWEPIAWKEYPSTRAFALGEIGEQQYLKQWADERAAYHEEWKGNYARIKAEKTAEAQKVLQAG
ncbi:MAG: fatty acid desaturase CarF family protein [Vulcanimicrobiota bacterium]